MTALKKFRVSWKAGTEPVLIEASSETDAWQIAIERAHGQNIIQFYPVFDPLTQAEELKERVKNRVANDQHEFDLINRQFDAMFGVA